MAYQRSNVGRTTITTAAGLAFAVFDDPRPAGPRPQAAIEDLTERLARSRLVPFEQRDDLSVATDPAGRGARHVRRPPGSGWLRRSGPVDFATVTAARRRARPASRSRSAALTRWRSRICSRVLAACSIGCSEKKAWMSATSVGRLRVFTVSTMRMIVFDGNRSLTSAQFLRTNVQARAPWRRLAMHVRSRNGAFWVLTSPLSANSHVRSISSARRTRPARRGGGADPAGSTPSGTRRASARTRPRRRSRRRRSWRPPPARDRPSRVPTSDRSYRSRHRAWVAASSPSTASAPVSSPRSLPTRSVSVSTGSPRSASAGATRRGDALLKPRERLVVEEPSQPAQADHDRLPDGVLALVGESLEERQQVGRREAAGDDRVPRVVDEVVALERVERAERIARQPGAQLVVVGDPEEPVPAGVDDDGGRRVGEREARFGPVEEQRVDVIAVADRDRHDPQRRRRRFDVEAER